jgi:hypothetical protein
MRFKQRTGTQVASATSLLPKSLVSLIFLNRTIDLETDLDEVFPALSYGLYKAISKDTVDGSNNGHCSTYLCEYANFDTLAVCSSCEQHILSGDINDLLPRCYWRNESADDYIVFGQRTNEGERSTMKIMLQEIEKRRLQESFEISITCGHPEPLLEIRFFNFVEAMIVTINPFGQSGSRPMANVIFTKDLPLSEPPELSYRFGLDGHGADMQRLRKGPIVGRYFTSTEEITNPESIASRPVHNGLFDTCRYIVEDLGYRAVSKDPNMIINSTCMSFTTDLRLWFPGQALSDQFGFLNGTVTKCSLSPCVQRIARATLQNNQYTMQNVHPITRWYPTNESRIKIKEGDLRSNALFCSGDDDVCLFSWTPMSLTFLGSWLSSVIDTRYFYKMYMAQRDGPRSNYTLFYKRESPHNYLQYYRAKLIQTLPTSPA